MRVAVIIPAHNEAATIGDVARRARSFVEQVAVIDDGSTDDTCERARRVGAVVLRNDVKMGKGASL
jgi:glycosyltransferase involved in cell wall biosynthesis